MRLIDASQWFQPLRNLGKNCELAGLIFSASLCIWTNRGTRRSASGSTPPTLAVGKSPSTPAALEKPVDPQRHRNLAFCQRRRSLTRRIYAQHGGALYREFAKLKPEIEAWLKGEDGEDGDDEADGTTHRPPESGAGKRRKKLLDAATWQRDRNLVELAPPGSVGNRRGPVRRHNVAYSGPASRRR